MTPWHIWPEKSDNQDSNEENLTTIASHEHTLCSTENPFVSSSFIGLRTLNTIIPCICYIDCTWYIDEESFRIKQLCQSTSILLVLPATTIPWFVLLFHFITRWLRCVRYIHCLFFIDEEISWTGWVDLIDCLVHFHQLQRCHSYLRLYIVGLHLVRCQRHRDISDDQWLILYNQCCQRSLHLVSFLDFVTIERLVDCIDHKWRDYSSLCRWEHQLKIATDAIHFHDNSTTSNDFSIDLHRSSIRQCDYSRGQQWQCFDCHHRCLTHRGPAEFINSITKSISISYCYSILWPSCIRW